MYKLRDFTAHNDDLYEYLRNMKYSSFYGLLIWQESTYISNKHIYISDKWDWKE